MRFSLVEAVNQAWSAVSGSSAASVLDKLQDRRQRRRIIDRARAAIERDSPTSARQLVGLLGTEWFVDLIAAPDDPGARAAAGAISDSDLAEWFAADEDPELQRDWVVALAGAVWSVAAADATVVEAVHSALLRRVDETTTHLVNVGLDTYGLLDVRTEELKGLIEALPERISGAAMSGTSVPIGTPPTPRPDRVQMINIAESEADLVFDRHLAAITDADDVHAVLMQAAARWRSGSGDAARPVTVFVESYSDLAATICDEAGTTDPRQRRANARARDAIGAQWAADPLDGLSRLAGAVLDAAARRVIPSDAVGRVFVSAAQYWRQGRNAHPWDVSLDVYRRRDTLADGRPAGFTIGLSNAELATFGEYVRREISENDAGMFRLPDDLLLDRAFGALLAQLCRWEQVGLLPDGVGDSWATYFGWTVGPG